MREQWCHQSCRLNSVRCRWTKTPTQTDAVKATALWIIWAMPLATQGSAAPSYGKVSDWSLWKSHLFHRQDATPLTSWFLLELLLPGKCHFRSSKAPTPRVPRDKVYFFTSQSGPSRLFWEHPAPSSNQIMASVTVLLRGLSHTKNIHANFVRAYASSSIPTTKNFINGQFVESKTTDWIDLKDPATNEGIVPLSSKCFTELINQSIITRLQFQMSHITSADQAIDLC